jgi:hypothetical protein
MSYRDFVTLSNDDGTLLINSPNDDATSSEFNSTFNVSLACVTELIRGTREAADAQSCVRIMFDLLVLRGVEVSFWPFAVRFPWEVGTDDGDGLAIDGPSATTTTAAAVAGVRFAEPHYARHTDDDGDGSIATFYLIDWFALLFLILFFSAVAGVCLSSGTTLERVVVVAADPPPAANKPRPPLARPTQLEQHVPLLTAPPGP